MSHFTKIVSLILVAFSPVLCFAQGTLRINFDGPPYQPPGPDFLVQSYFESGMYFQPVPGTDGFGRCWNGQPAGIPDDGTPYIVTGAVETLAFGFIDDSEFGLRSVDLAGFSIGAANYTVHFVGYDAKGNTIQTSFSGSGIDFQTYDFGPEWSSGLTRVEIPNYDWSLDNLVVAIPEPGIGALFSLGALAVLFGQNRNREHS